MIGTGETPSVREFVELAFGHAGLDYRDYVVPDPELFRPAEVNILQETPPKPGRNSDGRIRSDLPGSSARWCRQIVAYSEYRARFARHQQLQDLPGPASRAQRSTTGWNDELPSQNPASPIPSPSCAPFPFKSKIQNPDRNKPRVDVPEPVQSPEKRNIAALAKRQHLIDSRTPLAIAVGIKKPNSP